MLGADYPIQCRCGRLRGTLSRAARTIRLSCYCRDCQTYAHALGDAGRMLDAQGGTEVVATLQQYLSFSAGREALACLSLSPRGTLRWYAACCNTAIANTARDPKLSYLGIVHTCLGEPSARAAAFGPPRAPVNTKHAYGKVTTNAWSVLHSIVRIVARVLRARLDGSWRRSPFFPPDSAAPVVAPRVLNREERERARRAAGHAPGAGAATRR